jgi:hypothetical protein
MKILRTLAIVAFACTCLFAAVQANAEDVVPVYLTLQNGAVFSGTLTFSNNTFTDLTAVNATLTDYELGHKGFDGTGVDDIDFVINSGSPGLGGGRDIEVADCHSLTLQCILDQNNITLDLDISNNPPTVIDNTVITLPIVGKETVYLSGADLGANDFDPTGQQVDAPNDSPIAPEPGSFVLLGTGLAGLAALAMRGAARAV